LKLSEQTVKLTHRGFASKNKNHKIKTRKSIGGSDFPAQSFGSFPLSAERAKARIARLLFDFRKINYGKGKN
jgi:hypothetical protein